MGKKNTNCKSKKASSNDRYDIGASGTNKAKNGKMKRKAKGLTEESDDFSFRQSVENGSTRTIIEMSADGNCLFRSLSDQLYYDHGNSHEEVRSEVCDYMQEMEEDFKSFLVHDEDDDDHDADDFESYVRGMRQDGEWGGNLELVAAARLYRRNIVVYSAVAAWTIEHGDDGKNSGGLRDMMVSYHENDHYNSVRDNSQSKPPPPPQKAKKRNEISVTIESKDSGETEAIYKEIGDNDESAKQPEKESTSIEQAPDTKPATMHKRTKKNAPCPCGSGLKYRKCCYDASKSKERAKKWKDRNLSGVSDPSSERLSEHVDVIEGDFKAIKI